MDKNKPYDEVRDGRHVGVVTIAHGKASQINSSSGGLYNNSISSIWLPSYTWITRNTLKQKSDTLFLSSST
jgi:hypothetical protein